MKIMTAELIATFRKTLGVNTEFELFTKTLIAFEEKIDAMTQSEPAPTEVPEKKAPRFHKHKICNKSGRMKLDAEICECEG